ncbi:MAG: glutathione S-transferase N-terminal domain-containing protein, partial [SAR324 cluster bacterium]|nr:glutathione S-transferase N-terminal domain-containing protein [SAR324 cluster bacterium]
MSELSDSYKIFGSELSPYSVKVRSYFRYKKIAHEWTLRSEQNMEEFERLAKLPLIPLVVTPEQDGIQDSTPILERMESLFPEPSIHPENPALAFISALIEEYGDEWVNKPMFHYRWSYVPDQWATAERIARQVLGDANGTQLAERRQAVRDRMIGRLAFVGSSEQTRQQIEDSLANLLSILEAH